MFIQVLVQLLRSLLKKEIYYFIIHKSSSQNSVLKLTIKTFEVWFPQHEQVKGFSGDDDTIFNLLVSQLPELLIICDCDFEGG